MAAFRYQLLSSPSNERETIRTQTTKHCDATMGFSSESEDYDMSWPLPFPPQHGEVPEEEEKSSDTSDVVPLVLPDEEVSDDGKESNDASMIVSNPQQYEEVSDNEEETNPLEYARSVGFCRDFTLDHPCSLDALSLLPWSTTHDLDDPQDAQPVFDASHDAPIVEKLECPIASADLLGEVLLGDPRHNPLDHIPDHEPRKGLRVELPLLLSNHERDMKRFCRQRENIDLSSLNMSLEHVDVEADEGLDWPSSALRLPGEIKKTIESERLAIPSETIKYLQGLAEGEKDVGDLGEMYKQCDTYVKVRCLSSLSCCTDHQM